MVSPIISKESYEPPSRIDSRTRSNLDLIELSFLPKFNLRVNEKMKGFDKAIENRAPL